MGASNDSGVVAIFGDLGGYFFGNVRDKASNITWRHATPCRAVIDCKINHLDMSGYFTSKSVFDQQGCRALTFALASFLVRITVNIRRTCYNYIVTVSDVMDLHRPICGSFTF